MAPAWAAPKTPETMEDSPEGIVQVVLSRSRVIFAGTGFGREQDQVGEHDFLGLVAYRVQPGDPGEVVVALGSGGGHPLVSLGAGLPHRFAPLLHGGGALPGGLGAGQVLAHFPGGGIGLGAELVSRCRALLRRGLRQRRRAARRRGPLPPRPQRRSGR